jgi:hypothetical protein
MESCIYYVILLPDTLSTAPQRSLTSQSKNIPPVLRQKLRVRVAQFLDIMVQGQTHSL